MKVESEVKMAPVLLPITVKVPTVTAKMSSVCNVRSEDGIRKCDTEYAQHQANEQQHFRSHFYGNNKKEQHRQFMLRI